MQKKAGQQTAIAIFRLVSVWIARVQLAHLDDAAAGAQIAGIDRHGAFGCLKRRAKSSENSEKRAVSSAADGGGDHGGATRFSRR